MKPIVKEDMVNWSRADESPHPRTAHLATSSCSPRRQTLINEKRDSAKNRPRKIFQYNGNNDETNKTKEEENN